MMNLNKILDDLKNEFTINGELNKRYYHTIGVIEMALTLNRIHKLNIDEEKIIYASAYHDIAKFLDKDIMIKIIKDNYSDISCRILEHPPIWHSFVGRVYAKEKYKINDEEVLLAIEYHTTGRPNMSDLEKLIFVSDAIEKITRLDEHFKIARKIAYKSLDKCVLKVLEDAKNYQESIGNKVDELNFETYKFYYNKVNNVQ